MGCMTNFFNDETPRSRATKLGRIPTETMLMMNLSREAHQRGAINEHSKAMTWCSMKYTACPVSRCSQSACCSSGTPHDCPDDVLMSIVVRHQSRLMMWCQSTHRIIWPHSSSSSSSSSRSKLVTINAWSQVIDSDRHLCRETVRPVRRPDLITATDRPLRPARCGSVLTRSPRCHDYEATERCASVNLLGNSHWMSAVYQLASRELHVCVTVAHWCTLTVVCIAYMRL